MTVTLYSLTPPTKTATTYMLRPTKLNGPRTTSVSEWVPWTVDLGKLPKKQPTVRDTGQMDVTWEVPDHEVRAAFVAARAARTLDDIDDWHTPQIEDDGFLERLDRSAEIVRFP